MKQIKADLQALPPQPLFSQILPNQSIRKSKAIRFSQSLKIYVIFGILQGGFKFYRRHKDGAMIGYSPNKMGLYIC
jgi:hypothetical protein